MRVRIVQVDERLGRSPRSGWYAFGVRRVGNGDVHHVHPSRAVRSREDGQVLAIARHVLDRLPGRRMHRATWPERPMSASAPVRKNPLATGAKSTQPARGQGRRTRTSSCGQTGLPGERGRSTCRPADVTPIREVDAR